MSRKTITFLRCPEGDWESNEIEVSKDDGSLETDYARHWLKEHRPKPIRVEETRQVD